MKKVCVSVTNDLATDQRVLKVCEMLARLGYSVKMVGRKKSDSLPFSPLGFETKRFRMVFHKGFLFYAEYNLKLFFYLLFQKGDVLVANDLDTLLPNYLVSRIKRLPLVYDSHEYFLGSAELTGRSFAKGFWRLIERNIFPKLHTVFTVNDSISCLYHKEYGVRPSVVRNLPRRFNICKKYKTREELGWPADQKIILMQGGAINVDRGAEELIRAMQPCFGIKNARLWFIGGGDVWEEIQTLSRELNLEHIVKFIPRLPYDQLMEYTSLADLGVTLDKPVSDNYRYSLPNKLFDYIGVGLPVLASPLVEVKKIVETYKVGLCVANYEPGHIASKIKEMLEDDKRMQEWKSAAYDAAEVLNWEKEVKVMEEVYKNYL